MAGKRKRVSLHNDNSALLDELFADSDSENDILLESSDEDYNPLDDIDNNSDVDPHLEVERSSPRPNGVAATGASTSCGRERGRSSSVADCQVRNGIPNIEYDSTDSEDEENMPFENQVGGVLRNVRNRPINRNNVRAERNAGWSEADVIPSVLPFSGAPGVQFEPVDRSNPIEFARKFVTDDFLDQLCYQTNLYAEQFLRTTPRPAQQYARFEQWKPVTKIEMLNFLGLMIITGVVQKPTLDMYWSTRGILLTPIFSSVMSRNRFTNIMKFLHFNDNQAEDAHTTTDRLYKIRPILNHMCNLFKALYVPEQQLALDEGMLGWRGRLRFRVYNPGKITKYGIMLRMTCESISGYICTMQVYDGNCGPLQDTVGALLQPYEHQGYQVFMDNFYNSVKMTETLLDKGIESCGTIRINRGIPDDLVLVSKGLKRDESSFRRRGDILLQCWKDKKLVSMISTFHKADIVSAPVPANRRAQSEPKKKRLCIVEYNKYMHGVDRADQYLAYYPFVRKTTKWPKKVFFYFLQVALFNAFIMFSKLNPKKMTFMQFLCNVAEDFVSTPVDDVDDPIPQATPPSLKRAPVTDSQLRLDGRLKRHKMVKIPPTAKKEQPYRKCRVCLKSKKRVETRYLCAFCEVPLHPGECFQRYHTLQNY